MISSAKTFGIFGCAGSLLLAPSALAPAIAQEFCVACTKPDAVYRCVIEKAVPTGKPLKWLCLGALARQGGHADCHVRKGTVFDCDAPIRRIDAMEAAAALESGAASLPPAANRPGTQQQAMPPRANDPASQKKTDPISKPADAPPRTVEEAARNMSKSSGDALGNAGNAIANSTRKAWGCVTSLFKAC